MALLAMLLQVSSLSSPKPVLPLLVSLLVTHPHQHVAGLPCVHGSFTQHLRPLVTETIVHRQDGMLRCCGCCTRTRESLWDQRLAVF